MVVNSAQVVVRPQRHLESYEMLNFSTNSAANSPERAAQTFPSPPSPAWRTTRRRSSSGRKMRRYGTPTTNRTRTIITITTMSLITILISTSTQTLGPTQGAPQTTWPTRPSEGHSSQICVSTNFPWSMLRPCFMRLTMSNLKKHEFIVFI